MMVAATLILTALSWALWLFSHVFHTNKSKLAYAVAVAVSVVAGYSLYNYLGAQKDIQALANKHQELSQYPLEELATLVSQKKLSANDLFNELRLRLETTPSDAMAWMKFGDLLLLSSQTNFSDSHNQQQAESMLLLAKQAFNRASQLGSEKEQVSNRVAVANTYVTYGQYDSALEQLNLVLLKNQKHEGALMMKGLTESMLERHQDAMSTWSYLLLGRDENSESAQLINNLIAKEQQKLNDKQTQYIEIEITNFSQLDLHSFTKAFALVRPIAGGAPIAVKSIEANQLTKSIKITPENLMLDGSNLWQAIDLKVEIRLSKSGFAKAETGDKFGFIAPVNGLKPTQKFVISIDKVVN